MLATALVLAVCEDEALAVVAGDVLLVIEPEVCDDVSLLATVELLVELVASDVLPVLAKPLVLPVGVAAAVLEVDEGDVLAVAEPEACDDVSLLATLPVLAVCEAAALEVEADDSLLLIEPDVLAVFELVSLLATLLLVDGVELAVVDGVELALALLVEEGDVLLIAPELEFADELLMFALIFVFWFELLVTFELLLEDGVAVEALVLFELYVEPLPLVDGVVPLLLVPYALEPVVPLVLPAFCVLLL